VKQELGKTLGVVTLFTFTYLEVFFNLLFLKIKYFLGTTLSLYRFWFSYNIFVFIICRCSSFSLLHTHVSRSPLPENYGITDGGRKSGRGNYHESGKLLGLSGKTSRASITLMLTSAYPLTIHTSEFAYFY